MATDYEDIDSLVNQQNLLLQQQEQKQNDIIQQQTQMQVDELNREKEKLEKETDKTTQGLYANWQKQANQYGVRAEQLAQQGLGNSGYAETTRTALYNTYQKSVTDTLNNSRDLYADYNFKIQQARQNGSIQQAQSALELYSQRLQLLTQNYELRQNREQFLYQQERDRVSDSQWQKSFDEQIRQNEIENQWKQKNYDYQVQRDNVSDNQWQQQFDYQKQRNNIADSQWQQQFDYEKQRNNVSDNQWLQQFNYQKQRDAISDSQWQQQFNLSKKKSSSGSSSNSKTGKYEINNNISNNNGQISDYAKKLADNMMNLKKSSDNGVVTGALAAINNGVIEKAKDEVTYLFDQGALSKEEVEYIFSKL